MKKVIFLDIDGVLNDHNLFRDLNRTSDIDLNKVCILKHIIQTTGARIVLSSSWRYYFNETTQEYLESEESGITASDKWHAVARDLIVNLAIEGLKISDLTIRGGFDNRGNEVREYLMSHRDIDSFVILDDDTFPDWNNLTPFWIKTVFFGEGLNHDCAKRAIEILNTTKNPYKSNTCD